ncbi:PilZ domain-containing protein [Wenzhouxiangella sp. EGI_FJ10409]|uniref:PilZ domain-containing protein n=1 Tax=Wenzhouxiangella sp. EGI_FJ10409 TaxID=3243767 RepID=UPI0035E0DE3B
MSPEQERRRFHRFPFHADCELLTDEGDARDCELLDLSINGALVALARPAGFDSARHGDLTLKLRGLVNGDRTEISARVQAVRVEEGRIACRFVEVDAGSFENLKELVAENLGDLSMLDRELTQLDYWPGLAVSPVSD